MGSKNKPTESTPIDEPWPHCVLAEGNCIVFDLVSLLGSEVNQVIMEYIWNSSEGSRLTLQKTRQGFTVQVTGEVNRSEAGGAAELDQFKSLKQHLDSLKNKND